MGDPTRVKQLVEMYLVLAIPLLIISKNSRLSVSPSVIFLWDKSCRDRDLYLSLNTKLPDIFGGRIALYRMCSFNRIKVVNSGCIVQINVKMETIGRRKFPNRAKK